MIFLSLRTQIVSALLELKDASLAMQKNPSNESLSNTMKQYDLLFAGERFNMLLSKDLHAVLVNKFEIPIDLEEFHKIIPDICASLGMRAELERRVQNLKKPIPDEISYLIILN